MGPERKFEHGGQKVEEFYNKGYWVVYWNNKKTNKTYEEIVDIITGMLGKKPDWCSDIKGLKKQ